MLFRRQFIAQLVMTRAYARLADESQARRDLVRAVERAEAIATERRLAQEALQHSERRFRDIAEFSADWIWESDTNHRFTFLSGDGAQAVFGKTRWEVAGADATNDPYWRRHKADLDARRPFRGFRFSVTWPESKTAQHFSASGKPIFDDEGRFQGYRGTITNETEAIVASQRARLADRLLRDAVDSISEGFVIFDAEDRLVMANDAYRRIYPEIADLMVPGTKFEDIIRTGVARGQFADAENREEEWIAERIRCHRQTEGAVEQRLERRPLGARLRAPHERRRHRRPAHRHHRTETGAIRPQRKPAAARRSGKDRAARLLRLQSRHANAHLVERDLSHLRPRPARVPAVRRALSCPGRSARSRARRDALGRAQHAA